MAPQGRAKRPGLDALLKGVARREFDIVAAWSVCRLDMISEEWSHPLQIWYALEATLKTISTSVPT